jgi:hypothetical protein
MSHIMLHRDELLGDGNMREFEGCIRRCAGAASPSGQGPSTAPLRSPVETVASRLLECDGTDDLDALRRGRAPLQQGMIRFRHPLDVPAVHRATSSHLRLLHLLYRSCAEAPPTGRLPARLQILSA